jgi:hypothetical protein
MKFSQPYWLAAAATGPSDMFSRRDDHTLGAQIYQILILAGIILAVGAMLFLVVYLFKRRGSNASDSSNSRHRHRHRRHRHWHSHRRRKRLTEHRGRNPTLAETGGLPPLRPEPPPKPPS